jgi:hypothetical protein
MTLVLLSTLVLLALVDSTSFGTLLIPIWLMLAPGRLRPGRIVVFLATVAAFYLALGLLLVAGVASFSDQIADALQLTAVQVAQLVLGLVLLALGVWTGFRRQRESSGRMALWREQAVGDEGSTRGLMALALTAALVEAASMVPYLAAIGLVGTADLSRPVTVAILAAYCVVMVVPALLLLVGRVAAARHVEPVLHRVDTWMKRNAQENTAWILGIIGFIIASDAARGLGING